ncbi:MAG TPA: rhomboid family intramembrane serine protease [Candidatus Limnocylindria bacterium]|nr:rhomboid family intramembrane serine protease [Candidatus Limnocylindria bacterium]
MKTSSLLILSCITASLWTRQQDPGFAANQLVFSLNKLGQGRSWTRIAPLFVHANPLHLFGNMLFLFVFGRTLENSVGPRKLLAVFFLAGFATFILSIAFLPRGTGMLGASAAIFALAGRAMLVRPLRFTWLFFAPQGVIAMVYFLYNLIVVFDESRIPGYDPQVAYISQVIGFFSESLSVLPRAIIGSVIY